MEMALAAALQSLGCRMWGRNGSNLQVWLRIFDRRANQLTSSYGYCDNGI
jgi:hypothetical protein